MENHVLNRVNISMVLFLFFERECQETVQSTSSCHFYFFFVAIAIHLCSSKTLKNVHFIQEILFFLSKQNNKAFYLLLFFMSAKCEMFIKYFLIL